MTSIQLLEWTGSLLGLTGAALLALNTKISRWGWVFFLAANVATASFALGIAAHGLLLQQVGFTATSLLGLYRAWRPAATANQQRRLSGAAS